MAFDVETKMRALVRSEERCECTSDACGDHDAHCQEPLRQAQPWHAVRKNPAGPDSFENCELVCLSCYEHRQ